jgi:hypothetical protein
MTVSSFGGVHYNMAFHGDYTPVLAKHSKHSSAGAIDIGLDRIQRDSRADAEAGRRQV